MSRPKLCVSAAPLRKYSRGLARPLALVVAAGIGAGIAAGSGPVRAQAPASTTPDKPTEKAASKAMTQDPTVAASLASFLREYHHALAAGNRQFLAAHTLFPLPYAEGTYDMEAKAKERKLGSVGELMKLRQDLRWPEVLVPKNPEDLAHLQRGVQKCDDKKSPDVPDFTQGGLAIELHGDEATLTYLNRPCESETHVVTLSFVRNGQTWKLRQRAVRIGIT